MDRFLFLFFILKWWDKKQTYMSQGIGLSGSVRASVWLTVFHSLYAWRFCHMFVWQNLCHSAFRTLIWEPCTRHGRHFGLCHWFGIELCASCPSLSVEINDACLWPCIKICTPPPPPPPLLHLSSPGLWLVLLICSVACVSPSPLDLEMCHPWIFR